MDEFYDAWVALLKSRFKRRRQHGIFLRSISEVTGQKEISPNGHSYYRVPKKYPNVVSSNATASIASILNTKW
jgi:hypothetical protein